MSEPVDNSASPTENITFEHLAFENSLEASVVSTVSSGKIILVNKAACQLLGYNDVELKEIKRDTIFDISESHFKKMLIQRAAEGQSFALVTCIQKDGSRFPCEITSAVFTNSPGGKKAITTIHDLSKSILKQKNIDEKKEKVVENNILIAHKKQLKIDAKKEKIIAKDILVALQKSDARIEVNNVWINYIAKSSYDVMWDWDILTGLVYLGDSIEEVLGYKIKNNTTHLKKILPFFLREEKATIERELSKILKSTSNNWSANFKVKRKNGTIASTISRAGIIRDENGKAIRLIGATQDVSMLMDFETKLKEQNLGKTEMIKILKVAAQLSFDGRWDWNLLTNEFFLSEGYETLFGHSPKVAGTIASDWRNHIHPRDKKGVEKALTKMLASAASHWEYRYRCIKADGTIADVCNRATVFRKIDGTASRIIGIMQDVTEMKKIEKEKKTIIKELLNSNADLKKFSYITSHNLRAPLSNIQSILTLINYDSLDENNTKMLSLLKLSAAHLTRTIEDLSSILIIKNNKNVEVQQIKFRDVFTNLYITLFPALKNIGGKIYLDLKVESIYFNYGYLENILTHLFSNAINYCSPSRNLIIKASSKRDSLGNTIFCFSDNGSGMDLKR